MRGLVLGGGGLVGVAWEVGLATGLLEGGVDWREADVIVGTSAGSIVGTRVAAGHDWRTASEGPATPAVPVPEGGPDLERLGEIFELWSKADDMSEWVCRRIGELAQSARTASAADWVQSIGGSLGIETWPDKDLRITAVDVADGRFHVHSASGESGLHEAVASSCAVPGMFPPVPIGESRFMDGGVRSGTNADILLDLGPDAVMVVAPITAGTAAIGAVAERAMQREVDQLRAAGARVVEVVPGADEIEAFGGNLMDATRTEASMAIGRERGLALAKGDAGSWIG